MANVRRSWLRRHSAAVVLGLLLAAGPAAADNELNPFRAAPEIWVYQDVNADGYDDNTYQVPVGIHNIPLRITGGETANTTGTLCHDISGADGQEICAVAVRITVQGNGQILNFTPASGLSIVPFIDATGTILTFNLTTTSAPLLTTFPPPLLGTLQVDIQGDNALVLVSGDMGIGPNREEERPVRTNPIVAPEPAAPLLWLAGLAGLFGLTRLRRSGRPG